MSMLNSAVLSAQQLERVLDKVLEKLAELNPDLQLGEAERKKLAKDMAEHMTKGREIKRAELDDPSFINKLFVASTIAVTLHKADTMQDLGNLLKNKLSPADQLKLKFKDELSPAERKDLVLKLEKIMKNLTPEEKKQFELKGEQLAASLDKNLRNSKLGAPKPSPKGKKSMLEDDVMMNLLGMINHHVTGSIPVVVQYCMGNGRGFPDVNPFHGLSQLDQISKKSSEDNYGMGAAASANYASGGSLFDAVAEVQYAAKYMTPNLKV